jgi:hypothetical protein
VKNKSETSSPHTTKDYILPLVSRLKQTLKYSELNTGQYKLCQVVKHKPDADGIVIGGWFKFMIAIQICSKQQ